MGKSVYSQVELQSREEGILGPLYKVIGFAPLFRLLILFVNSVRLVCVQRGAGFDVCGGRVGVDQVKFCAAECAEGLSHFGKVAHAV